MLGSRLGASTTRAVTDDGTNPGRSAAPTYAAGSTATRLDAAEIACGPPPEHGE